MPRFACLAAIALTAGCVVAPPPRAAVVDIGEDKVLLQTANPAEWQTVAAVAQESCSLFDRDAVSVSYRQTGAAAWQGMHLYACRERKA